MARKRTTCPSAREFRKLVNMSPSQIRKWSKDERAVCYSYPETRDRLDDLADLRKKPVKKWTEADCELASRVVSFIKRMRGGMRRDGCTEGYAISLRNWGHRTRCKLPKTCEPPPEFAGFGKTTDKPLTSNKQAVERIVERHPGANLTKLPRHIEPFGHYMQQAAEEPVTARRIIKAYLITRSSVQRPGRPKETICKYYPDYRPLPRHADLSQVRPEDVMSRLLFTEAGDTYLDAAEQGRFDKEAARELADRMLCFGLIDNPQGLFNDMRYAVKLGQRKNAITKALEAKPDAYWRFVSKQIKGIGPSKAGFFAALFGRGDIPTFDARERSLWLRYPKHRKTFDPKWRDVKKLKQRFESFPMALPDDLEPYRVHLVHHALWDAYAPGARPTKTTHGSLIRSMQFAGMDDVPQRLAGLGALPARSEEGWP